MESSDISRRTVLTNAVGLGALTVGAGLGDAAQPTEYNIGTASPSAAQAARQRADAVLQVLDWGGSKKTVTGVYSAEAVEHLRNRADVRYVEQNGTWQALAETLPWGIDRTDADVAHGNGDTGDGADIAIIDTGIDDDHEDLQANLADPSVDTNHKAWVDCRGRNCNYPWSDDHDHGTHCAGIADAADNSRGVIGVSTQATLHALKVLDKNGRGSWSDVAAAIEHTADQGWDVGSMSLGGSSGSSAVKDAVQYAYDKGVLLVAAAGNDGPCSDCVSYPAKYQDVIAVSATSCDDSLAGFSSTGPEVELAAPGENVYSSIIGSYDTFSGTSMACPHVAGAGGQLMANGYTNTEARKQLKNTAEDLGLSSNEQGAGLLDVAAALGYDSSDDGTGNGPNCGGSDGGGGDNAPTATIESVTEVNSPSPHAEFDVSWAASDKDGDLDSAKLTLDDDTAMETEDSKTVDISGDSASDTTRLTAKHDEGSAHDYTVTVVVTDASGHEDTATAETSEDGQ